MERRLSAILAADMVGYSRLVRRDEDAALAAFRAALDEVIAPSVAAEGGRVFKLMGDGVLAEFQSAAGSVRAAVGIQTALAERGFGLPEESRVEFRIGVNLGDVVIDGDDIQGDGVNVAARLESVAEPGGVCISSAVHEQVRDRLEATFEDGGETALKNIDRPVRVWRWRPGAATPARAVVAPATRQAPVDKPSIAVLPFENMSGDPEQEFFADGMAEDVITALSRMPWFFVIARNSSFVFKGRAVGVKEVARDLGVTYVLEGSVRRAGPRIRITAQLVDATTGAHVWAERYDRDLSDIFAVQDEVTEAIVSAIAPEFLAVEARRARRKDPASLDAWECVVRARAHLWRMSREDSATARGLIERAIALTPDEGFGLSDLALILFMQSYYNWVPDPRAAMAEMVEVAGRAVAADPSDPWALTAQGWALVFDHRWDDAVSVIDRAAALAPNFAPAIGIRGGILALSGRREEAIEAVARAMRLSPRDGMTAFWLMGLFWAYFAMERYEEARETAATAIRIAPDNPTFRRQYASALSWLGRVDEARAAVADYLRIAPSHSQEDAARVPARNREEVDRFVEGLRRAGLRQSAD